MPTIQELKDKYTGQVCYIIGTGPSILNIQAKDFGEGVVIAIHNAIHIISRLNLKNDVYNQWRDESEDEGELSAAKNLNVMRLVCKNTVHGKISAAEQFNDGYIFDCVSDLDGNPPAMFSHFCAVEIATKIFGCNKLVMIGFDSYLDNYETINFRGEVGGEIRPGSYWQQMRIMKQRLKDCQTEWFFTG